MAAKFRGYCVREKTGKWPLEPLAAAVPIAAAYYQYWSKIP